jgi:hypothetical protein
MSDARKYLINALRAEKADLLATLPHASGRRAAVIREEIVACESLLATVRPTERQRRAVSGLSARGLLPIDGDWVTPAH